KTFSAVRLPRIPSNTAAVFTTFWFISTRFWLNWLDSCGLSYFNYLGPDFSYCRQNADDRQSYFSTARVRLTKYEDSSGNIVALFASDFSFWFAPAVCLDKLVQSSRFHE